jgi:hypothetical protein
LKYVIFETFNKKADREAMSEQRRFPRMEKQFVLSYYDLQNPDDTNGVSTLKNISKGGLSFCATHKLVKGSVVGVQLRTPFHPVPVHFEGLVVGVTETRAKRIYFIRLQFQELSDEANAVVDKAFELLKDRKILP